MYHILREALPVTMHFPDSDSIMDTVCSSRWGVTNNGEGTKEKDRNDFVPAGQVPDITFRMISNQNRLFINLVTVNFEMQNKFFKKKPNTISRVIYYGASVLHYRRGRL